MTMSDRIVVLAGGELQQAGTPDEIYHRPINRFVADFIGSPSMNFIDVEIRDETLVGSEFTYRLSTERLLDAGVDEGTTLELGVRPERVRLVDDPDTDSISAVVDVVEPIGSDNYVYLRIGDENVTVRVPDEIRPTEGETVEIAFDESSIHLFDAASGDNVLEQQSREQTEPTAQ